MAAKLTKHRTQIYLTDDQFRKVKMLARTADSTMAEVVRDAVNQYHVAYSRGNRKVKRVLDSDPFFKLDGFLSGPKDLSIKHDEYWDY
jgi:hypothetical protein